MRASLILRYLEEPGGSQTLFSAFLRSYEKAREEAYGGLLDRIRPLTASVVEAGSEKSFTRSRMTASTLLPLSLAVRSSSLTRAGAARAASFLRQMLGHVEPDDGAARLAEEIWSCLSGRFPGLPPSVSAVEVLED